jgi:threonine/homoserine/homoserine lactone efflux protein
MVTAFFTGLTMSFLGSITPTGPIALLVLRRGLRQENSSAISLAAGAAVAEAGYALLAYLGITYVLSRYPLQASVLKLLAGLILMIFAIVCIITRNHPRQVNERNGRHGVNFLMGFSIAGLNPTFLATWAGAVAIARGVGLISEMSAAPAFAAGVIAGPIIWFVVLIKLLTKCMGRFRPETLVAAEKALPIILFALAGVILFQAFIQLSSHL